MPALGSNALHYGALIVVFIMTFGSLFFRNVSGELAQYIEKQIDPVRGHLLGIACLILGSIHFVGLLDSESIFMQIGYLVLVLAFFEAGGIANRFIDAYSGEIAQVSESTLKRLVMNQFGMLAMVFVLSVLLLYLSLMVVVGFTDTWSVAVLAAVMILALAFITMVRKL